MTQLNEADPLRELLVDAATIDREALAGVLKGRVAIDNRDGRLVLLGGYRALDSRKKVLTLLLAQKAATLLGASASESLSHGEVTETSGLPSGTVAPSLKNLKELRFAAQDQTKAYFVPNAQLAPAIDFITTGGLT